MANNNTPLINYNSRDFASIKADLINYITNYHSDLFSYFNENSPDMVFLDLLAYIGDNLSYETDLAFNESFLQSAQTRESLIRIAQSQGFNSYYPKGSTTQAYLQIQVPAIPNSANTAQIPNPNYLIGIYAGMQCQSSNGSIFECLDEINFASTDRQTIIPNYDANNNLINFTVQKAITLYAGQTKIQRFYVSSANAQPFLEVYLDDPQVTQVISVVAVAGNTFTVPDQSQFQDFNNAYVQVENLAQSSIFVPINPLPANINTLTNQYTDMSISYGQWVNKPQRFIVRRDSNNMTKLIFGSTLINYDVWEELIGTTDISQLTNFSLSQVLTNYSLGQVPGVDTTLFIQFRSGSGVSTNAISNSITNITNQSFYPVLSGVDFSVLDSVRNSLSITSNLPAIGGSDPMTNEELRNIIGGSFAANDRAVTYQDVITLVNNMPAQYGIPFRISYEEIKPIVLNYSQVQNYIATQMATLLTLTTQTDRVNLVNSINTFLTALPTQTSQITQSNQVFDIVTSSNNILQNVTSLWVGEKCRLYVLGIDQNYQPTGLFLDPNDNVWKSKNVLIKQNIKNYLQTKRIIGDWIDIVDANIVNFQVYFTILTDASNKQTILVNCLTALRSYFNVFNWQINMPIYISNVQTIIQQIQGVVNVVSLTFVNVWGQDASTGNVYSPAQTGTYFNNTSQSYNSQNNKFVMGNQNNVITTRPSDFL